MLIASVFAPEEVKSIQSNIRKDVSIVYFIEAPTRLQSNLSLLRLTARLGIGHL